MTDYAIPVIGRVTSLPIRSASWDAPWPFASFDPAPPPRLCETCAYWRPEVPREDPIFGRCACPRVAYGHYHYVYSLGEKPSIEYAVPPPDSDEALSEAPTRKEPPAACADMLLYSDYESYHADLLTGRDFGCVHWRERRDE